MTTRRRLDFAAPYATVVGEPGVRFQQNGRYFRADGTDIDDPPDPPKPPPIEQPGALIKVDNSIWKQLKAELWGGYGGFDEDEDQIPSG